MATDPTFTAVNLIATHLKVTLPTQLTAAIWNHADVGTFLDGVARGAVTYRQVLHRLRDAGNVLLEHVPPRGRQVFLSIILNAVASQNVAGMPHPQHNIAQLQTQLSKANFNYNFGFGLTAPAGRSNATRADITAYLNEINDVNRFPYRPRNNKIITNADNVNTWHAFNVQCLNRIAATHPDCKIPIDQFRINYRNAIMGMGDVGTKIDGELANTMVSINFFPDATRPVDILTFTFAQVLQPAFHGVTGYRRLGRGNCIAAAKFAKENNHIYAAGQEHGMPPDLGWLGFDFSDVYPTTNNREAVAIRQAKQSGLFRERSAGNQFTNVGTNYQRTGQQQFGNNP